MIKKNVITGKTEGLSSKEKQAFDSIIQYLKLENIDENLDKGKLSGGEKKKINLARFMYEMETQNREVVVLDEPTNHIDIGTKELLEEALEDYKGTLIFISHDRYFINKLANKILCIENGIIKEYVGNYEDYRSKRIKAK